MPNTTQAFTRKACLGVLLTIALSTASPQPVDAKTVQDGASADWLSYERAAEFSSVVTRERVPLRDGESLGCNLYRPANGRTVAPGKFPALVLEFTPYADSSQDTSGSGLVTNPLGPQFATYVSESATYFAQHGYVVAVCNVRGTGESTGTFPTWFRAKEARDNYELIEWLASQKWASGDVGQAGSSYGSLTSQRVAALRPPHLRAIFPQIAPTNIYEWVYPGGVPSTQGEAWAYSTFAQSLGRANPVAVAKSFTDHPLNDAFWRQIDVTQEFDDIHVPTLVYGGWQDLFTRMTVSSFTKRDRNAWLVMGPGQHTPAAMSPENPIPLNAQLAWWDHWLLGARSAPLPSTRVTSFELPLSSGPGWQEFNSWPPSDVQARKFYLGAERQLTRAAGHRGVNTYDVDPLDGPARSWLGDSAAQPTYPEGAAANQQVADARRLTFTSDALKTDRVVAGAGLIRLVASFSSVENARLVVKLEDVAPDGSVVAITDSYRNPAVSRDNRRMLTIAPDKPTAYLLRLRPTHWRFLKGHRIRIAVTSGDVPLLPPFSGPDQSVSVFSGTDGSWVSLPFRA